MGDGWIFLVSSRGCFRQIRNSHIGRNHFDGFTVGRIGAILSAKKDSPLGVSLK